MFQAVKHNKVDCAATECNLTPCGAPEKPKAILSSCNSLVATNLTLGRVCYSYFRRNHCYRQCLGTNNMTPEHFLIRKLRNSLCKGYDRSGDVFKTPTGSPPRVRQVNILHLTLWLCMSGCVVYLCRVDVVFTQSCVVANMCQS